MTDLREQLAHALGTTYRIERELGGGGMSRVFLAEETALARQVVIKVLPPEMAASVNQDRFRREVQLAARLQHPHIVPLLTAGASGDLLYYVMPFIKGESLREKLDRESELPVGEVVRILREVTDALAYAHSEGVVHRDIKPDNVMISGGHALVTDFGVAKAVSDSAGASSLTSFGLAIGTPAYMSPEQASGDPNVDHRADLYALGATAFEMLAGRPPFIGRNPQALLAAHVTQQPEAVNQIRPAVPAGLNSVVMRCLEKRAADRWQHATELLPYFELLLTPSTGGMAPTNVALPVSSATEAALRRSQPMRVLATFALASVGVLGVAWLLVQQVGLPNWVFYATIGLLVVGLPVVLLTGKREREMALARTKHANLPAAEGIDRHLTWRKAVAGGTVAFASLGAIAIVYMAMRVLGIGSVGTLMAKGTLHERDRIVLAEFENRTGDSTLATTVTELLRTDLAQSRAVSVYDAAQLASVVTRMQLPANTHVTFAVAKDVATREGLKAILAGEIASLGSAYVLSARLVATGTGDLLWTERENVANASELSAAIDRLSNALRERIGESLRSIRADPPLEQMTTSSTEALRLYAEAERAANAADNDGAIGLLKSAIKQDSMFAMAHRRLGMLFRNRSVRDTALYLPELRRAYELRDRLSIRERYLTEASYFTSVAGDTAQAISAYQALLGHYPDDPAALNNLGFIYSTQGKKREALTLYKSAAGFGGVQAISYSNSLALAVKIEGVDSAGAIIDRWQKAFPENPNAILNKARFLLATERFDSARVILEQRRSASVGNPRAQIPILVSLLEVASVQGRLDDSFQLFREFLADQAKVIPPPTGPHLTESETEELNVLSQRANSALDDLEDTTKALAYKSQELSKFPLDKRGADPGGDDYANVVTFYARANRPAVARQYLAKWEAKATDKLRTSPPAATVSARAAVAIAEGRLDDALRDYRQLRAEQSNSCAQCFLKEIAFAHERAGRIDSAIVNLERYYDTPRLDVRAYPVDFERLGSLYALKGDTARALQYYGKVIDNWKNADAALKFRVTRVQEHMDKLRKTKAK